MIIIINIISSPGLYVKHSCTHTHHTETQRNVSTLNFIFFFKFLKNHKRKKREIFTLFPKSTLKYTRNRSRSFARDLYPSFCLREHTHTQRKRERERERERENGEKCLVISKEQQKNQQQKDIEKALEKMRLANKKEGGESVDKQEIVKALSQLHGDGGSDRGVASETGRFGWFISRVRGGIAPEKCARLFSLQVLQTDETSCSRSIPRNEGNWKRNTRSYTRRYITRGKKSSRVRKSTRIATRI